MIFSAMSTHCSAVAKPMIEPTRGYVVFMACVTPIPPPIETLKPNKFPVSGSLMAIKPTSLMIVSEELRV